MKPRLRLHSTLWIENSRNLNQARRDARARRHRIAFPLLCLLLLWSIARLAVFFSDTFK